MGRLLKGAALFIAIACVVWIGVLWRWQSTARDMSPRDIVVYLGLLPIAVFVFALLLRWAWRGALERQQAAPAAAKEAAPSPAVAGEAAARHATSQLLGAYLVCAAGASADELQSAAKDGQPMPALDALLRNADGLPVLTARIADIDPTELEPDLTEQMALLRTRRPEWAEQAPGEHVLRALAALQEPLRRAVATLAPWADRFSATPAVPDAARSEARVRVLLGWPADWSAFEQELGRAMVGDWLARAGGNAIRPEAFAVTAHAGGEPLLLHADRLLQTLAREGRDDPLIVAACHSALSQASVDALEDAGALFSASGAPHGQMPGEAAAALVLAGPEWPRSPDADQPPPHLHRPALLRRDKSVDAPGRIGCETVMQALDQSLAVSRLGLTDFGAVVCDADMHTARGDEFYRGAANRLATLEPAEDMRLIGSVTGAVGVVSPLLVVACAAQRATAGEQPCLAMSLNDPFVRLALAVRPGPPIAVAQTPPSASA